MPTVYVINRSVHDFSKAEKFGQLVYLSNGAINKYATSKMARKFEEMLQDSAEEDYILITSLTVMNIIACSIFVCIHKKLNLLIHDTNNNTYIERRLDFTDIMEALNG